MREIKYDIWRFEENEKDHLIAMVAENSYAYSETKSMFQECKTIDDVVKKINELYETGDRRYKHKAEFVKSKCKEKEEVLLDLRKNLIGKEVYEFDDGEIFIPGIEKLLNHYDKTAAYYFTKVKIITEKMSKNLFNVHFEKGSVYFYITTDEHNRIIGVDLECPDVEIKKQSKKHYDSKIILINNGMIMKETAKAVKIKMIIYDERGHYIWLPKKFVERQDNEVFITLYEDFEYSGDKKYSYDDVIEYLTNTVSYNSERIHIPHKKEAVDINADEELIDN